MRKRKFDHLMPSLLSSLQDQRLLHFSISGVRGEHQPIYEFGSSKRSDFARPPQKPRHVRLGASLFPAQVEASERHSKHPSVRVTDLGAEPSQTRQLPGPLLRPFVCAVALAPGTSPSINHTYSLGSPTQSAASPSRSPFHHPPP